MSNFPELDPFAVERSHKISQTANEHARATGQACILINGGAATAVIAFLSKDKIDAALLMTVPRILAGYAVGVFFGALMMFCMTQAMEKWNLYWYFKSHGASDSMADKSARGANRWAVGYNWCFVFSIMSFVLSSIFLGMLFYPAK